MKTWTLHLVWMVVTLVSGVAWGQYLASRVEHESRERESGLRADLARAKAAARSVSAAPAAPATAPAAPDAAPGPEPKPAEAPLTPAQIRQFLMSADRKEQQRALKEIERNPDRAEKLALLRDALAAPEDRVRERALELLKKLGGPEAAGLVAQALRTDEDGGVRERAARYLGDLKEPIGVEALREAFSNGGLDLRVVAAESLGDLGDPAPTVSLLQTLGRMQADPDGAVRQDAVNHIKDLDSPASIPYLAQALRDTDSDIRRDAIDALYDLRVPEAIPVLEQALNDPNPRVAGDARRAIERLKNPQPQK